MDETPGTVAEETAARRWGRWALVAAGVVLGIAAAEAVSRRAFPGYDVGFGVEDFNIGGFRPPPGIFRPSEVLGWERDPSRDSRIGDAGFRRLYEPSLASVPPLKVLVLGDSIMDQIMRESRWQAEGRRLERQWGRPVRIDDFTGGGYGIHHYRRILEFKCVASQPDVLLIGFCINDVGGGVPVVMGVGSRMRMFSHINLRAEQPFSPWLFRWSHLYRATVLSGAWNTLLDPDRPVDDRIDFEEAFSYIVRWCRDRDVRLLCAVFPYFQDPETYDDLSRNARKILFASFARHGVRSFALEERLPPRYWERYRNKKVPADYIHPDDEGVRVSRGLLVDFLAEAAVPD
jgi:lysophospholipase L1-like esterase